MKITGSLALLRFDDKAYLAALNQELEGVLIQGLREYVSVLSELYPSWTGRLRASLEPLADLAGIPLFTTANPEAGEDNTAEGRALGDAKLILPSKGGPKSQYLFTWESDVFYLELNENLDMTQFGFHLRTKTPYHAQSKARSAFYEVVNPQLRNLRVKPKAYLRVQNKVL